MTVEKKKITPLPNSEIEIEIEIPWSDVLPYRSRAIERFKKTYEIKGFRPGKAPEEILLREVGEIRVLEEAAKEAIALAYETVLRDEKIKAIGFPDIRITKIAAGNPLGFTARTALFPQFTLPDYKEIARVIMARKNAPVEVTEKEVSEEIENVRREIARREHAHKHTAGVLKEGDGHQHENLPLPPLTDEFVQKIGDFKNISDFKEKIKAGLAREKEMKTKNAKRVGISERLIQETKIDLPRILIEHEQDKLEGAFRDDILRTGLNLEKYLAHIKKTIAEMRKEWEGDAKKRATLQLILSAIATMEKIEIPPDIIKKEVDLVLLNYKEASRERVEWYVTTVLINEKVFEVLELEK